VCARAVSKRHTHVRDNILTKVLIYCADGARGFLPPHAVGVPVQQPDMGTGGQFSKILATEELTFHDSISSSQLYDEHRDVREVLAATKCPRMGVFDAALHHKRSRAYGVTPRLQSDSP
jgi:hypothetical protein